MTTEFEAQCPRCGNWSDDLDGHTELAFCKVCADCDNSPGLFEIRKTRVIKKVSA